MDAITNLLPIGIHFGLPEERHHADGGLGSTRIKLLRRNPTAYWQKHINPNRKPDKATRGRTRGTALHTLLFHGEQAFDRIYCRGAEHDDDMSPSEKGAATKAANLAAAKRNMIALPAVDYDQIAISQAMIEKNSDLKSVFTNGFPEVTVIWERDGVRLKARIDYLKVRGVGDLKGAQNKDDMDFEECCRLAIARYRYDLQCALYMEARRLIPRMVSDGMVYGDHDASLLKNIAESKSIGWQWVFYCMEGAPEAISYIQSPGNPMMIQAERDVEIAISRYVRFKKTCGDEQWFQQVPAKELTYDMMPQWFARIVPEEIEEYEIWMKAKAKS